MIQSDTVTHAAERDFALRAKISWLRFSVMLLTRNKAHSGSARLFSSLSSLCDNQPLVSPPCDAYNLYRERSSSCLRSITLSEAA